MQTNTFSDAHSASFPDAQTASQHAENTQHSAHIYTSRVSIYQLTHTRPSATIQNHRYMSRFTYTSRVRYTHLERTIWLCNHPESQTHPQSQILTRITDSHSESDSHRNHGLTLRARFSLESQTHTQRFSPESRTHTQSDSHQNHGLTLRSRFP